MSYLRMSVLLVCTVHMLASAASAQLLSRREAAPTHADTLRGMLTPLRTCYDISSYWLDVRVDPATHTIAGANTIAFRAVNDFDRMQVDLFKNMQVDSLILDEAFACGVTRDENAMFVAMPHAMRRGEHHALRIVYHGQPLVARRPPWDGGFIWASDSSGNPWVAVACQGTGASLWWPNKDHPADEPDSIMISVTVPPGFEDVSNGRLRARTTLPDGWTRFDWFVSSPINNYSVTVNIGKFAHFTDVYTGADTVTLDYYVLPQHLEKAKRQFAQVKPMMAAFERYFGPYPFVRDGYKLVESPHLGMEHQSCVAYGNDYLQGYHGRASSAVGLSFDFIIIHESAHEWWGNNVTASDNADMWIHESFGAYAEALFVEAYHGRDSSLQYINAKRQNVRNDAPMAGPYGVNKEGSGDMYDKGQLVLNTLRSVINNDSLWFSVLRGMQERFRWKTISYDSVVAYINERTGEDFSPLFEQFYRHAKLPRLVIMLTQRGQEATARYRWDAEVDQFAMPVELSTGNGKSVRVMPTSRWGTLRLEPDVDIQNVDLVRALFFCDVVITRQYIDERVPPRGISQ